MKDQQVSYCPRGKTSETRLVNPALEAHSLPYQHPVHNHQSHQRNGYTKSPITYHPASATRYLLTARLDQAITQETTTSRRATSKPSRGPEPRPSSAQIQIFLAIAVTPVAFAFSRVRFNRPPDRQTHVRRPRIQLRELQYQVPIHGRQQYQVNGRVQEKNYYGGTKLFSENGGTLALLGDG